ncbi:DUF3237 domain-containing protein [Rhizobium lusitanum]|uniref:Uncharacterized protein n=1 Tax=Rhizobium lusitanum TaxID=293958 RepID=A0A7X0IU57_9HYPH|nr:DUF3237 domain-containing protein [Rhizobium lusitanum]MBB6487100.1 hypothetical protein [Rhizobium lusitanum]
MSSRVIFTMLTGCLILVSLMAAPAYAQSPTAEPVAVAKPDLHFLMRFYAPLQAPIKIDDKLVIFQPREGGYVSGPRVKGEIVSPTADWVRTLPDGTMRIDVRSLVKLSDGSTVLVTYGGVLAKPAAESWERFMSGKRISAPEWYYVVAPNFETSSQTFGWLNGIQAVGKFVSIQTGPEAHVAFDIYEVR